MSDNSIPLRKAIMTHLRADAAVTALIPAARLYGAYVPPDPEKPFARYGAVTKLPDRASCLNGMRVIGTLHGFAYGDSEDAAGAIGAAFKASLDGPDEKGIVLILSTGDKAHVSYGGGQTLPDPEEAGLWHEVISFEATVAS